MNLSSSCSPSCPPGCSPGFWGDTFSGCDDTTCCSVDSCCCVSAKSWGDDTAGCAAANSCPTIESSVGADGGDSSCGPTGGPEPFKDLFCV